MLASNKVNLLLLLVLYLSKKISVFTCNEVIFYELLFTCNEVRFLVYIYFFTSLLLLNFGEVKTFKVILKAKSAMRRLVRMCLAQSGYGSWP